MRYLPGGSTGNMHTYMMYDGVRERRIVLSLRWRNASRAACACRLGAVRKAVRQVATIFDGGRDVEAGSSAGHVLMLYMLSSCCSSSQGAGDTGMSASTTKVGHFNATEVLIKYIYTCI